MAQESPELDIPTIYNYDTHRNIPWNIIQYKPVREYNHGKTISFSSDRYVTKRGFYMDPHIKYVKEMPPPDKYPTSSMFDQTANKQYSHKVKINPRLKKNTYHDQIVLQGKKTKIGVGSYYIQPKEEDVKRELKRMKKRNHVDKEPKPSFIQDVQCQTKPVPGPGNYNPHLSVDHIKKDRMIPEKWVEKHKKENAHQLKAKKKIPGPSSYRPSSAMAGTFDYMKATHIKEKKKKGRSFSTGFGTDAKFQYERPNKKVIKEQRPDSWRYDLRIKWNGKADDVKKRGWNSCISTRPQSASVYH